MYSQKSAEIRNILGVRLNSTSLHFVLRKIIARHKVGQKYMIVTPNPEQLIIAAGDTEFKDILNKSLVKIPDGVGLSAAAKFLDMKTPKVYILKIPFLMGYGIWVGCLTLFNKKSLYKKLNIIKGRVLFHAILVHANKRRWKVVFIGDDQNSAQKAAKKLSFRYTKAKIIGITGPRLDKQGVPITPIDRIGEKNAVLQINKIRPDFLFVGFGAPVQEKWLYRVLSDLEVNGTMGVGGTFDYVNGKQKLPPIMIEKMGLEWLWRLFAGNQNLKRLWNAVVVFPWKVFLYKLKYS